jgi:hypothetical protein
MSGNSEPDRLNAIRILRSNGTSLGELFDAGYTAGEIVEALGVMPLARDLALVEES